MFDQSTSDVRCCAKARVALLLAVSAALTTGAGCQSIPISGRTQMVLIPESQEIELGAAADQEVLESEPLSENVKITQTVERVGQRIAAVADRPEYEWEFHVIAEPAQNAFALPGGKVAVYEGILAVCQSEADLAVVMSHEIAHALARHGGERMSQQAVVGGVGSVINAMAEKETDAVTVEKVMQGYGVASQLGYVLPFSRKHESEADAIGLILMAKAGYDPSVAPEFWERFAVMSSTQPPEWLSTHPADARRAAELRALLPEAMKYYETAAEQHGLGESIPVEELAADPQQKRTVPAAPGSIGSASSIYGSVSALTSPHSGKRGEADDTTIGTWTEQRPEIQQAAAKIVDETSASFQLPVMADADDVESLPTGDGWSAARDFSTSSEQVAEPNPFK